MLAVNGTQLVREAQERHGLSPTATAALGRAMLGALLMATYRKADESLQMTFFGDGPLGGIQVIAESSGVVKGKVGNPTAELPLREDGKLDVGGAVGEGVRPPCRCTRYHLRHCKQSRMINCGNISIEQHSVCAAPQHRPARAQARSASCARSRCRLCRTPGRWSSSAARSRRT